MNFDLQYIEKQAIIRCFIEHRADRNRTAKALGVSRPNFYYKVKKHNINLSEIAMQYNFIGYINSKQRNKNGLR